MVVVMMQMTAAPSSEEEEEEEEVYLTAQVATSLIRISPIKQVNSILLSG